MVILTGREASLLALLAIKAPLTNEQLKMITDTLTGPALKIAKNLIKRNKCK